MALIASSSADADLNRLLRAVVSLDGKSGQRSWYVWIASPSNPADAPSRGGASELRLLGAQRVGLGSTEFVNIWQLGDLCKKVAAR
eukprot:1422760-Amphidinium_carterae.1